MTLGENVKLIRKKNGWKQQFLAKRLGIATETLSLIERDRRLPRVPLLSGLARELGTTVEYLTREDPRFTKHTKVKNRYTPVEDPKAILESLPILVLEGKLTLEQIVRAALEIK